MKVHDGSASAWFDQFIPYLAEHPEVQGRGQWCARHWAPCPAFGANGIGAATELMQVFVSEIASPGFGTGPEAMNAQMDAAGHLCCTLGDERMYEIWGHWPPASGEAARG